MCLLPSCAPSCPSCAMWGEPWPVYPEFCGNGVYVVNPMSSHLTIAVFVKVHEPEGKTPTQMAMAMGTLW